MSGSQTTVILSRSRVEGFDLRWLVGDDVCDEPAGPSSAVAGIADRYRNAILLETLRYRLREVPTCVYGWRDRGQQGLIVFEERGLGG